MYENQYAGAYDSKLPRMGAYGRHTLYSGTQHVEQSGRPLRRHPILVLQTLLVLSRPFFKPIPVFREISFSSSSRISLRSAKCTRLLGSD